MAKETQSIQELIEEGNLDILSEDKPSFKIITGGTDQAEINNNEEGFLHRSLSNVEKSMPPEGEEQSFTCCTTTLDHIRFSFVIVIFLIILFIIFYLKYYFKKSEHKIRKAIIDTIITLVVMRIAFLGLIFLSSPLAGKFTSFFNRF